VDVKHNTTSRTASTSPKARPSRLPIARFLSLRIFVSQCLALYRHSMAVKAYRSQPSGPCGSPLTYYQLSPQVGWAPFHAVPPVLL